MKVTRVLGWILIPYLMIFISWKRLQVSRRTFGIIWSIIAALMVIGNLNSNKATNVPVVVVQNQVVVEVKPTPFTEIQTPVVSIDTSISHTLVIPSDRFPETVKHIKSAIEHGESNVCTIDRKGADENRKESLKGFPTKKGYDRDEFPMAMCAEGGIGADVAYINPTDNRGEGSWVGNQLEKYPDGTKVLITVK